MAGSTRSAVVTASAAAAAMIAFQVGGKATRDALFLSSFAITSLPAMVVGAALVSVIAVLWTVRRISRQGPWQVIPALFAASTALLLIEWALIDSARREVAVLVYLHFTVFGALLISGFWSMVNERFDPRTARREIGRIGAAGTVGGVLGGVLAERTAAMSTVETMLPLLAGLHLLTTVLAQALRRSRPVRPPSRQPPVSTMEGLRLLGTRPYLRNIVVLAVLCTVAEGLVDFVFKGQAAAAYGNGRQLLQLFAAFYTGVAVITFVVQGGFTRFLLDRLGLARTASVLPGSVALTGAGALLFPGLPSAAVARGTESIAHNSLFRSSYELLFTPIGRQDKRATKTLVDVGSVRLGDVIGGGIVQASLFIVPALAFDVLLALAVVLSLAAILVARRLHAGYREALERNLIAHGGRLESDHALDTLEHPAALETLTTFDVAQLSTSEGLNLRRATTEVTPPPIPVAVQRAGDTLLDDIGALRSRDRQRVRAVLRRPGLQPELAPHLIPLLAWDEAAADAAEALRSMAPAVVGQLLDVMLDPAQEFTIRRRIPAVLVAAPGPRAVEGLLHGLADRRFEVRYRSGRALAEMASRDPALHVPAERVFEVVLQEVMVDRQIWESQRLLSEIDDAPESPFIDDFLRERAGRSMEHVFTVLSLALPAAPLRIAFRGLFTSDDHLRGTALEYLENALPENIRLRLWPFLEDQRPRGSGGRDREEILADLMRSNDSISLNLEELRRRASRTSPQ